MLKSKILFILTGSISLYKMAYVLSHYKKMGADIKVVATPAALQFLGTATIEGLTSEALFTDMYATGHNMDHIHLIRWADIIVCAPTTANFINKMANGIADDLASTLFLAHDFTKPFVLFPAMNTAMYLHPVVKNNIQKLIDMKIQIIQPTSGELACGEVGIGRLPDPHEIIKNMNTILETIQNKTDSNSKLQLTACPPPSKLKIMITAGGTQEPIDDVRVITNKSTGKTAARIADFLIENDIEVHYVHAESAQKPLLKCLRSSFVTAADLQKLITHEVAHNHFLIHCAAVSDYTVKPFNGKINSDSEQITLELTKTPKLINLVKKLNPHIHLIGFKLTSQLDEKNILQKINKLFTNSQCDWIIQNDWQQRQSGIDHFQIFKQNVKQQEVDFNELCIEILNYINSAQIFYHAQEDL